MLLRVVEEEFRRHHWQLSCGLGLGGTLADLIDNAALARGCQR
jgi:hypothetical protein